MVLRNRLKERRAALNVNQQEMGRLCGVSRQTISLIERGDYSPSVTLALTIAKVCGVAVEEIFYLQKMTWIKSLKTKRRINFCLWNVNAVRKFSISQRKPMKICGIILIETEYR